MAVGKQPDTVIEFDGEYTTARVMGLEEGDLDEATYDQIERLVNHDAFRNPMRVMPDTHFAPASIVGLTMPVGERVVPNVIGVDIGCGMIAVKLADPVGNLGLSREEIDERVRARVPMGWGRDGVRAPERDYHHLVDDFPWERVNERLENFVEQVDAEYVPYMQEFLDEGGYDGKPYFDELVEERAGTISKYFDDRTAINQAGTLGAGNHFIEICEAANSGDSWVVIHSGSRGLGENTAKYWQREAIDEEELRQEWYAEHLDPVREELAEYPADYLRFDLDEVDDEELRNWLQGGKGEDFINYDAIPKLEREDVKSELKALVPDGSPPEADDVMDDSLAYLDGEQAAGYLIDMLFCQEYAVWNRTLMAEATADAIGTEVAETIHARHNIVDFRDGMIRKGATRAYEGERAVVPFNMSAGTLLVEGKSNDEWHCSVCHGAGRVKSRGEARRTVTEEEIREQMEAADAYASELPLDEAPDAYKDTALIEDAIEPTAEVLDRLEVLVNFKAPSS